MANNPNAAANLRPAKKGEVRNPKGRPKGVQSWSTIVRELLDDPKLPEKLLKNKPGWWESVKHRKAGELIVVAMITRALGGDEKAATWLRKTGYGDKLDITSGDKEIKSLTLFNMNPQPPEPPKAKAKPKKKPATKKKAK